MRQKKQYNKDNLIFQFNFNQGDLCDNINTQLKYRDFMTIYPK